MATFTSLASSMPAAAQESGKVAPSLLWENESHSLDASLDASGATGGGEILIGADRGGESIIADAVPIPRTSAVVIDANTTIHANARKDGNGGKVVVWGDDMARVHGEISVQGGKEGGDGGFVETSSHGILDLTRAPDLRSPSGGTAGHWLIDPANIVIKESTSPDIEPVSETEFYTVFEAASDLPDPSVVDAGALVDALAVGGTVTVTTEVSGSVGDAVGTISLESPLVIPNDPDLQSNRCPATSRGRHDHHPGRNHQPRRRPYARADLRRE